MLLVPHQKWRCVVLRAIPFIAAFVLSLAAFELPATGDPPKLKERVIAKEPVYKSKNPRYCQLVFGPQVKQSVWLVIDGEDLYVDRNGNGDLTEDGERVTRKPAFQGSGFEVSKLDIGDGTTTYSNLIVYWTRQPPGATKAEFPVDVLVEVDKRYCQGAVFKNSATAPKDAPVIHFGGPLEMVLLGGDLPLAAPGKEQELAAVIGTRSSTGHVAMIRHDRNLSPKADVHPVAEVAFPGKGGGAKPVGVKVPLDQRCCNVRFYATLRTPAEVGAGKAIVTLTFPAWTDAKVGPTTKEVAVTEATPK
jgi:hypothetical protein